jgi:hypothetical protein
MDGFFEFIDGFLAFRLGYLFEVSVITGCSLMEMGHPVSLEEFMVGRVVLYAKSLEILMDYFFAVPLQLCILQILLFLLLMHLLHPGLLFSVAVDYVAVK